ncbi:MAG: DUF6263 family protein [Planctomycetaceae bacterium]
MKLRLAGMAGLFVVLALAGCDKSSDETTEVRRELPDWMSDGEGTASTGSDSPFGDAPSAELKLQLNPGDRFPLRKVVRQELTQSTLSGQPDVSYSQLEIMFAISVEEVQSDRVKLAVRYDRVKYQHNVAGEAVYFDSTSPPAVVPIGVRAYRDMVGDGFKFWLGQDNRIVDVEGFTDFLQRCTRDVPEEMRSAVMLGMEAGSGEDGIANFVDNSIGLLPYGVAQKPGDMWERPRYVSRPIPMQIQNQYTLQELTDSEAVVAIRGNISAGNVGEASSDSAQVQVTGGSTQGTCTIYRKTGLPKASQVERVVNMVVHMPTAEFRQQKRVSTTIESFPVVSGGSVMQVGFDQPAGSQGNFRQ